VVEVLSARVSGIEMVVTLTAVAQILFIEWVSAECFGELGIDLGAGDLRELGVAQADPSRARIDEVVAASAHLLLYLAGAPVSPPLGVDDFAVMGCAGWTAFSSPASSRCSRWWCSRICSGWSMRSAPFG
jgi:hypothetical protein